MPEIRRFGSFKLLMFFQDENPPHVHIRGVDFAAKIRISNGDLLAGEAPIKVLKTGASLGRRASGGVAGVVERIPEVSSMTDNVTRLTKARPIGDRMLRVRFAGDRRDRELDMTGLIARSAHFAPLMDDAETFAKAAIVEDGLGVAWPVQTKWGRLDVSASTLQRIAEEQQPMTGADFAQWRVALGLSLTEAAKLLGVGRRTIMGYLNKTNCHPSLPSPAEPSRATNTCWQRTTCPRGKSPDQPHELSRTARLNADPPYAAACDNSLMLCHQLPSFCQVLHPRHATRAPTPAPPLTNPRHPLICGLHDDRRTHSRKPPP